MNTPYWGHRRIEAHDAGRHVRPQVDCRRCWDAGAFADMTAEDTDGLWHRGQHSGCSTCAIYEAEEGRRQAASP